MPVDRPRPDHNPLEESDIDEAALATVLRTVPLGAAVLAGNSVDFILRNGLRLRARFANSCPALDFYAGFYLDQREDGQLCAGRDVIHSRAGGECQIDRFRLIIPAGK